MAGTLPRPAEFSGTADLSTRQALSPSYVNSFRISAVTSRLLAHLRGDANTDDSEFCNLCLSLARGIDYAVANSDVPGRAPDLPNLLKQVCQRKNDLTSQAAVMVLLISVKSACSNGWFGEKEKEELCGLSDEMQSNFCSVNVKDMNVDIKNKESNFQDTISNIMSRFYPGMKMGEILSLVETKVGYDSYVTDLHISKRSRTSPDDKIYMFVAQTDNLETSSCIINPQQVNFLLNGEGVDRRTCVYKDPGPQMPTPVTHMLKYGSNLLQVIGQFNARYIIVIAFMSVVSNPSFPTIPDYIQPASALLDPDNEITEGPSTVSLKCPISFSRIKIPVKGHTCKHPQCFDFNNYVNINSRRPLWRCPHCSQSVCFHDIRIDQSMVKVLKEVGEDVSFVKISADMSWEVINEDNEHTEKPNDAPTTRQDTNNIQNVDDIMDLTENDNDVDIIVDKQHDNNIKPSSNGTNTNTNVAPHMEDGFWREFYSSGLPPSLTNTGTDVSDIVQRNNQLFNSLTQGQSQSQSQTPVSNNISNMRYQTWVRRTENAVQALPAQPNQPQGQHTNTQNQGRTPPQLGGRSASPPVQPSGLRHTSPVPPQNHFNSHQQQSMNQRTQLPLRPSGQTSPGVRPGGTHGGLSPRTSLASSQIPQYSFAAIQRATSQNRLQTPVTSTGEQRDAGNSVNATAEENWRPTGRMRGSLTGHHREALDQYIIHPNQPVQAARAPPVLNTPRPFITPQLQALIANTLRSQTDGTSPGSGPGSDTTMAATAADAAGASPDN
ncbi:E4 SUMO-protein ligase PIAL2 [Rutidosis leptorrhynchoides]|uniref:E4 SUMO-protein ligase PIAL2 n=1 Tax=Rutidosis leptorrhynchoides TaxID=125765 RepID=UPI003A9952F6